MLVTLEVSHLPMSWSNAVALLNMPSMLLMSSLKSLASLNMLTIEVTAEVSHLPIPGGLHVDFPAKSSLMSVTWRPPSIHWEWFVD